METFWRITVEEVQDLAKERMGRSLTEDELLVVRSGFNEGIQVLCIAIDYIKEECT